MYTAHFRLRDRPFRDHPPAGEAFQSQSLREAVDHFLYVRETREAFFMLTGEVGTGKSTAIQIMLQQVPSGTPAAVVSYTSLSHRELLEEVALRFGLEPPGNASKPELLRRLQEFLRGHCREDRQPLLIVDEAQLLTHRALEEIRLLSNFVYERQPVLQICLVGQPELVSRLRGGHLRQLRQRITVRYSLGPLTAEETRSYLTQRLMLAGSEKPGEIFTADAADAVHQVSRGFPREINVVAGRAMLNAYIEGQERVCPEHVLSVRNDYGFEGVDPVPSSSDEGGEEDAADLRHPPMSEPPDAPDRSWHPVPPTEQAAFARLSRNSLEDIEDSGVDSASSGGEPDLYLDTWARPVADRKGPMWIALAAIVVASGAFFLWKVNIQGQRGNIREVAPQAWDADSEPSPSAVDTIEVGPPSPEGSAAATEPSVSSSLLEPESARRQETRKTAVVPPSRASFPQLPVEPGPLRESKQEIELSPIDSGSPPVAETSRPPSAPDLLELGVNLGEAGRLIEAITAFRRAIDTDPDYGEAHYNLAMALMKTGGVEEAIAELQRAAALQPGDALAARKLGTLFLERGQLDEATAALRQVIAREPDDGLAYFHLGVVLRDQGQLDEAITALRKSTSLRPDDPLAWFHLGVALQHRGLADEAIAALRKVTSLDPDDGLAFHHLGLALLNRGRLEEAIAVLKKGVSLEPDNALALHNLGLALRSAGRMDEAIAAFSRSIELEPDFALARYNRGLALMAAGRNEEARRDMSEADRLGKKLQR